ncbi:MAG TPA: hypothetical protein VHI13_10860 [Candidatus Kapabacteria bacterium]|nr:hypothetical protein [Candidatus Kapabacteria bacterium]
MMKITFASLIALCLCAGESAGQSGAHPADLQAAVGKRSAGHPFNSRAGATFAMRVPGAVSGAGVPGMPAGPARAVLAGDRLIQTLAERWADGAWLNDYRITNSYDANGYETGTLQEDWDTVGNAWQQRSKVLFTNDAQGNRQQVVSQDWDDATHSFVNTARVSYTLNSSGKVTSMLTELWENNAWANSDSTIDSYDANGYLTNSRIETWDTATTAWVNAQQTAYTNSGNGSMQQATTQIWDASSSSWTDYYRITYSYNAANKDTLELSEFWFTVQWIPVARTTHGYDANNFLIHDLNELQDFAGGGWSKSDQSDYTNNVNGDPTQIIAQTWDSAGGWVNSNRYTMTYGTPGGVAGARADEAFALYPNPAVGHCDLNFTLPAAATVDLSLVDGLGRTVATIVAQERMEAGEYHRMVDVGSLANGSYLAVLRVNGASTIRRVELVR